MLSRSFARRVSEIFQLNAYSLDRETMFQQELTQAALKNGWKILTCGYIHGWAKVKTSGENLSEKNIFFLDKGTLRTDFDPSLGKGELMLNASVHVFVVVRS